jgi:antitoxin VapB
MSTITKIFKSGGSQAVRIPKEFRLPGKEVRIRQIEGGKLVLEPVLPDIDAWFAKIDEHRKKYGPMDLDIDEPPMPDDEPIFD